MCGSVRKCAEVCVGVHKCGSVREFWRCLCKFGCESVRVRVCVCVCKTGCVKKPVQKCMSTLSVSMRACVCV